MDQAEQDQNVQMWKVKKLIKSLEAARGNGTSMISLILPVWNYVYCSQKIKLVEQ
jgi:peptide chain release factor subunit 1